MTSFSAPGTAAGPGPLLVVGPGRSGTTMLMRALAAHPGVTAYLDYPLELRLWGHVLNPSDEGLRRNLAALADEIPWTDDVRARFEASAALSDADARGFYAALAREQGKTARFAAEKYPPRLSPETALERTPDARAVLLVRDPLDVVASARRFDHKRGYKGFLEAEGDDEAAVIEKYASVYGRLADWRRRLDLPLVRYEALILSPRAALRELFAALSLASDDAVTEACIRAWMKPAKGQRRLTRRHKTTASAADSVGSWRETLDEGFARRLIEAMGADLRDLGYDGLS